MPKMVAPKRWLFDLDGTLMSEQSWETLARISPGGIIIAQDDLETENVQVITRWTGVPYDNDGDRFGIFHTEVVIPLSIFVPDGTSDAWAGRREFDVRSFSIDKFLTGERGKALSLHEGVICMIYAGDMRLGIWAGMSAAEREYRAGLPAF